MIGTAQHITHKDETEGGINPKKFLTWLLIVSSIMLFAAFTSAYIVRRGEGNWLEFDLPPAFAFNIAIVIISSVLMHLAYFAAKRDELSKLKMLLLGTLVTGIAFCFGQYIGWKQLIANNIYLAGNPSESFVYIISAMHLLHVVIGLVFVAIITIKALSFKVHKKNTLGIYLCTTYWHFVGALWIYLYFFFLINR
jgi:cytochrome c oxidase subunit 3